MCQVTSKQSITTPSFLLPNISISFKRALIGNMRMATTKCSLSSIKWVRMKNTIEDDYEGCLWPQWMDNPTRMCIWGALIGLSARYF